MPLTEYRGREGYNNLRIGPFRFVAAWATEAFNITGYYHGEKDHMLDFLAYRYGVSLNYNKL